MWPWFQIASRISSWEFSTRDFFFPWYTGNPHLTREPREGPLYHTLFAFEKYGGPSPGKNHGKTLPFREFQVEPRGRGEAGRGEYEKRDTKGFPKLITRINMVVSNMMHKSLLWSNLEQKSCAPTCSTQVSAPALSWVVSSRMGAKNRSGD